MEDQLVQEVELLRLRRVRYIPDIPDTLYMVQEKPRTLGLDVLAASIPGKYTLVFLGVYSKLVCHKIMKQITEQINTTRIIFG